MRGGSFCFVISVFCVTYALAAVTEEDENGKTKKYDTYDQRHIRHSRRPPHENINGNSFKISAPLSKQQSISRVDPNSVYSQQPNHSWQIPVYKKNSLSTFSVQSRVDRGSLYKPKKYNFIDDDNSGRNIFFNRRKYDGKQCSVTIRVPPPTESGCCGIDITNRNRYPLPHDAFWNRRKYRVVTRNDPRTKNRRFVRDPSSEMINSNSYSDRIASGKATHLEEFPWTVLIISTFYNGYSNSTLDCGGSIISSRFVLTAAHCIRATDNKLDNIEVVLSEYNKVTFPKDCKWIAGEGQICIHNIRTDVDWDMTHPEYNVYDDFPEPDIALIRLRNDIPYTKFIRPICLPYFDIDDPKYTGLRLTVAGWGLNGTHPSAVKQSTVLTLVPQCSTEYPYISESYLCAASRSGEEVCHGDSGGPLMMLYKRKYYLAGITSGRLSSAPGVPCGTPNSKSMYTNVYRYLDWIKSNVK